MYCKSGYLYIIKIVTHEEYWDYMRLGDKKKIKTCLHINFQ